MPAGTIEVFLIGAVGLKDTEFFGKADPYAFLFCGKQKLRSNTASNQGSKPVWNQKFSFYIDDSTTQLEIKIYNHNILHDDDELGHTIIPLAKVFADSKLPTTCYNVVRPSGRVRGEVKLSISFIAKRKPGQQVPQNIPGPYNAKTHGSPYAGTPPEPKVKHDPLIGPHGYFKSNSSNSSTTSSHGSGRPYQASRMDSYHPHIYPPVPPASDPQAPYHHTQNQSYHHMDSVSSSSDASSHGRLPSPSTPADYSESVYNHSPYGQGSQSSYGHGPQTPYGQGPQSPYGQGPQSPYGQGPQSPYGQGPQSPYGQGPHASVPPHASEAYPRPAGNNSSYPPVPSTKPSQGGGNQYGGFDDLAGRFGGLRVSENDSEHSSHGRYPGYRTPSFSNDGPPSGYPPTDSSSSYHGYKPPSNGSPPIGYPPSAPPPGYPTAGYLPHSDDSHGRSSHSGSFSLQGYQAQGYQAPPPSYYPPELGIPQPPPGAGPQRNTYPPVPYYNALPAHYIPAGYPK